MLISVSDAKFIVTLANYYNYLESNNSTNINHINPKIAMKKILLSAAVLMASFLASAQLVQVAGTTEISTPDGMIVAIPTISPDGNFVVVSDAGSDALTRINLADGATTVVTRNGNGHDVAISADGSRIVFRQNSVNRNHLRMTALKSVDLTSGRETELVAPTRRLSTGVAMAGNSVTAVENGRAKARNLAGGSAVKAPVVSINYGHLDYTADGRTVTLDPQGRGSYLWPALSPDGTKIVYYLAGRGCFVCDTDGSNVRALGMLRAAKWLDNNTVVGMNDVDDGEFITSSSIIASDLEGTRQVLTSEDVIALYPSASADGSKVAFTTPEGKLFVISLIK